MQACYWYPCKGHCNSVKLAEGAVHHNRLRPDLLIAVACILLAAALVIKWCGVIPRFRRVHSSRRKEGPWSFGDHVFDG